MKQQNRKKKRRASRAKPLPPPPPVSVSEKKVTEDLTKDQNLSVLLEAFEGISIEDATSAINRAKGDVAKAAEEILAKSNANWSEDGFERDSNWGTSSSGSSSSCMEIGLERVEEGFYKKFKNKAVTGTVGALLGKDYVNKSPTPKRKGLHHDNDKEKEEFLCRMLGEECELSLGVIRDVLCQCGYNVDKGNRSFVVEHILPLFFKRFGKLALDTLLDLCDSAKCDDNRLITERWAVSNLEIDSASRSSETDFEDNIWGYDCRNYSQVLAGKETPANTGSRNDKENLPQKVLESLFNIPKSSEHEPDTMNWRNVIKKMQSLGPNDVCPSSDPLLQQKICAKGDEYHLFRQSATQHWDSMKSCFQKAAVAYSRGQKDYAAYLSDKGRVQTKIAQEADKKASKDIFEARNKDIENVVTIDLHGQHVKHAMKVLKVHLVFGAYARSIQTLRVITGSGSHGLGKSKLKQSVIKLLDKEGIEWKEENQGTVLIKLDGYKEFSFMDSDADSD